MSSDWSVSLTQPAWLVTCTLPESADHGKRTEDEDWFDSEVEARAHIGRLEVLYGCVTYSLRRFGPADSRSGQGTLIEQSTIPE